MNNNRTLSYFGEYFLHEIPFIIIIFIGGMIIDRYLEKAFVFARKHLQYNEKSILSTSIEMIIHFLVIGTFITLVRKMLKKVISYQTIFSKKGKHAFDPKGRKVTALMHAFVFFFTQDNLKTKLKRISDKISAFI